MVWFYLLLFQKTKVHLVVGRMTMGSTFGFRNFCHNENLLMVNGIFLNPRIQIDSQSCVVLSY